MWSKVEVAVPKELNVRMPLLGLNMMLYLTKLQAQDLFGERETRSLAIMSVPAGRLDIPPYYVQCYPQAGVSPGRT